MIVKKLDCFSPEVEAKFGYNYIKVDKSILGELGPVGALLLSNLVDKDRYFSQHKKATGQFFLNKEEQLKTLGIGKAVFTRTLKTLLDLGLINAKRKGIPSRYWYSINYVKVINIRSHKWVENETTGGSKTRPLIKKNKYKKNKLKTNGVCCTATSPLVFNSVNVNLDELKKPSKSILKKQTLQKKADRVISQLNKLANKKFQKIDSNRKFIVARLNDGFKYLQIIEVIKTKLQDPYFQDNPKYFRPATLFSPTNFDSYLNEDPKDYKRSTNQNVPSNGSGYDPNAECNSDKDTIRCKINKTPQTEGEFEEWKREEKEKARSIKFARIIKANKTKPED